MEWQESKSPEGTRNPTQMDSEQRRWQWGKEEARSWEGWPLSAKGTQGGLGLGQGSQVVGASLGESKPWTRGAGGVLTRLP